eukprot:TRINITY_DN6869_c0_g1_i1.p1 TRINITY_DN6869_c0_g1~~TRINITY_DN6869_c0_g1_i1.p1  ORF type:complete len:158 (-),score=22.83 TRINITY_DN6869_c0_g1_i1:163-636(-)
MPKKASKKKKAANNLPASSPPAPAITPTPALAAVPDHDGIPPQVLEQLLLRKLDVLERDYLMTINATRKHDAQESLGIEVSADAEEVEEETKEEPLPPLEIPPPTPFASEPLPTEKVNEIKNLMSGFTVRAPSWASQLPDDVLLDAMLQKIQQFKTT